MIQHQDPTTKNPLAGQTGWNYYDRNGGRIAARWTAGRRLHRRLLATISAQDENTPFYSQLLNYNPLAGQPVRATRRPADAANGTACTPRRHDRAAAAAGRSSTAIDA